MRHMIEGDLQEIYERLSQELRRGILVLATLSQLDEQMYGYALISHLAEKGLEIDQGTLYPLLRRLEEQGMLDSNWDVSGSRPRRYYVINATGKSILEALNQDWQDLIAVMDKLLKND
jgi:PadR family transcriptional regulator PadR